MNSTNIAIAAGTALVGFGAGFLVASKLAERKYAEQLESDIQEVKQSYNLLHKKDLDNPIKAAEALGAVVKDIGYITEAELQEQTNTLEVVEGDEVLTIRGETVRLLETVEGRSEVNAEKVVPPLREEVSEGPITVKHSGNVFDKPESHIDRSRPYVVSMEEYMTWGSEEGWESHTYTWYDKDEVLTEEDDSIIAETDKYVGDVNLRKLSDGDTEREGVIYVINEHYKTAMEIVFDPNAYSVVVAGISEEQLETEQRFKAKRGLRDE